MWKKHDALKTPYSPVAGHVVVIAQLSDGYILSPMNAGEIGWHDCGDNVVKYRVPKTDISSLQKLCNIKMQENA